MIEVVRNGCEAILVEPDEDEIMNAVEVFSEDRSYARRLAENAYHRVVSAFSWDVIQELYLKLYESVLPR